MADAITTRFRGVESSPPPTEDQQARVAEIREAVLDLARVIDLNTESPRYKATALTDLESAAMFAVKGVFQPS